jgi:hypothetical protein
MDNSSPGKRRTVGAEIVATGRGLASGIVGGLLASLCCLPPAVALALGFGGSAFLVSFGSYQTEFHVAGFILMGMMVWWILRRARACRVDRHPLAFVALALGAFAASYLILIRVVTPWLYAIYARR